jgi:hypothetical protein
MGAGGSSKAIGSGAADADASDQEDEEDGDVADADDASDADDDDDDAGEENVQVRTAAQRSRPGTATQPSKPSTPATATRPGSATSSADRAAAMSVYTSRLQKQAQEWGEQVELFVDEEADQKYQRALLPSESVLAISPATLRTAPTVSTGTATYTDPEPVIVLLTDQPRLVCMSDTSSSVPAVAKHSIPWSQEQQPVIVKVSKRKVYRGYTVLSPVFGGLYALSFLSLNLDYSHYLIYSFNMIFHINVIVLYAPSRSDIRHRVHYVGGG